MNTEVIYIDSNPNEVVSAPVGTLFIRENSQFYTRTPEGKVSALPSTYKPKDYNRVAFRKSRIIYNTKYEIWEKVSGGTSNAGWQLVGYKKYFTDTIQYTPPTPPSPVSGHIDVSDDQFKDFLTANGVSDLFATGIGSSVSATSQFVWDSSIRHFRLDNMSGAVVTSDLLNLTPALTTLIGNIFNVRFQMNAGSSTIYFYANAPSGQPYLSSVSQTNAHLGEEYSGGPQEEFIEDMHTFNFLIKANITSIPAA